MATPKSKASTGFFTDAAAPAPGAPSHAATRSDLAKSNSAYGAAAAKTDKKAAALATAKEKAKAPNAVVAKKHADTVAAKEKVADNESAQEMHSMVTDIHKEKKAAAQSQADSQQELIEENNSKIAKLDKGSPDDQREADALRKQNKAAAAKRDASLAEVDTQNDNLANDAKLKKTLEKSHDDLEHDVDTAEADEDTAKKNAEDANDAVDDAQGDLSDAQSDEQDVKDEQAKEHPATFGKDVAAADKAKADAEAKKKKEAEEKDKEANKQKLKDAKEAAKKDKELTPEDKAAIDAAGSQIAVKAIIAKRKGAIALVKRNKRIKKLKDDIKSGKLTGKQANKEIQELERLQHLKKKIEGDKNKTLNEILAAQLAGALRGGNHNTSYLHFDAPNTRGLEGKLENIISDKMQPMYKHAYIGEFPEKLKNLDWLVKGMDRPKVDIEYVEQVRANVKRQYPVKYNYGDLSLTFLDDVHHKTIMSIYEYFTGYVWSHNSIKARGTLLLRDETVIPEIIIYDLTDTNDEHRKYTYQNVSMLSFDYDSYDDYEDGGVHSIQVVFKIEGFKIELAQSPRVLNLANDPSWF